MFSLNELCFFYNELYLPLNGSFHHCLYFKLVNGVIRYIHPRKTVTLDSAPVNDGQWHYVEARWLTDELILALDYGQIQVGGERGDLERTSLLGTSLDKVKKNVIKSVSSLV